MKPVFTFLLLALPFFCSAQNLFDPANYEYKLSYHNAAVSGWDGHNSASIAGGNVYGYGNFTQQFNNKKYSLTGMTYWRDIPAESNYWFYASSRMLGLNFNRSFKLNEKLSLRAGISERISQVKFSPLYSRKSSWNTTLFSSPSVVLKHDHFYAGLSVDDITYFQLGSVPEFEIVSPKYWLYRPMAGFNINISDDWVYKPELMLEVRPYNNLGRFYDYFALTNTIVYGGKYSAGIGFRHNYFEDRALLTLGLKNIADKFDFTVSGGINQPDWYGNTYTIEVGAAMRW